MASGSTARLALPYPVASDPNNVPADDQSLAARLDTIAATLTGIETLTNKTLTSPTTTGVVTEKGVHSPDLSTHTALIVRGLSGQTGHLWEAQDFNSTPLAYVDAAGALTAANYDGSVSSYTVGTYNGLNNPGSVTGWTVKLAGNLRWYHIIIIGGASSSGGNTSILVNLPSNVASFSHVGQWVRHSGNNNLAGGYTIGFGSAATLEFHQYGTTSGTPLTALALGFANGDVLEAWGQYYAAG